MTSAGPLPVRGWAACLPICSPTTGNCLSVVPSTLFDMVLLPMNPSTVVNTSRSGKQGHEPVVGERHRQRRAPVVAELLDDAKRRRGYSMALLPTINRANRAKLYHVTR